MPERSGKNVRRCQNYFRWYVRNYVRNYIRMVCQGRDHSKKVISIVRLAPPKGTTWAVFEPCLVDDEFGDCTSQHTGDNNNNNIIIISRYLIIQKGNPVLHQPIVSFCWHFHVRQLAGPVPAVASAESGIPATSFTMPLPWTFYDILTLTLRKQQFDVADMFGLFHPGPEAPMSNWGCFPPPKVISAATRLVELEWQKQRRTIQGEHCRYLWNSPHTMAGRQGGNGTFLGHHCPHQCHCHSMSPSRER